jgi:hypothetical protein
MAPDNRSAVMALLPIALTASSGTWCVVGAWALFAPHGFLSGQQARRGQP